MTQPLGSVACGRGAPIAKKGNAKERRDARRTEEVS